MTMVVASTPMQRHGPCIFPAICAGAMPCRSSKGWRPTAQSPWTRSTASPEGSRRAPAKPISIASGARSGRRWRIGSLPSPTPPPPTAPHHRRQQLHARGQLLLQRRTLHPARAGEDGDVSQGIARVSRGHGTPASRDRARRSSLREHEPARLFREGQRHRPPPDRRVVRRHGQRQGNERDLRGARFRQARDQHARHRRAGPGRAVAAAQHPQPSRLRSAAAPRPTTMSRRGSDVDPKRVAVMGYSFGGYHAPRIVRLREALRRLRRVRRHALEHP